MRIDDGILTWNTYAIAAVPISVRVDEISSYRITSGNDCPQDKGEILTPAGWKAIGTLYSNDHCRIARALRVLNPAIGLEKVH